MPTVPYPYPGENISSVLDLLSHANVLTEEFLGIGILVVIVVVSFLSTKSYSTEKAFGFAGFLTLISAILLRFLNLINDAVLYLVVAAFVGIVVWMWFSRGQEASV